MNSSKKDGIRYILVLLGISVFITISMYVASYIAAHQREEIEMDFKTRQMQSPVTPAAQGMACPLDGHSGFCPAPEKLFGAGPVTNHDPDVQADDDKATNALIHGFYSPMTPGNGIGE